MMDQSDTEDESPRRWTRDAQRNFGQETDMNWSSTASGSRPLYPMFGQRTSDSDGDRSIGVHIGVRHVSSAPCPKAMPDSKSDSRKAGAPAATDGVVMEELTEEQRSIASKAAAKLRKLRSKTKNFGRKVTRVDTWSADRKAFAAVLPFEHSGSNSDLEMFDAGNFSKKLTKPGRIMKSVFSGRGASS